MKNIFFIMALSIFIGFVSFNKYLSAQEIITIPSQETESSPEKEKTKNNSITKKMCFYSPILGFAAFLSGGDVLYKHKFDFGLGVELGGKMLDDYIFSGDAIISYYPFKSKFPIYVGAGIPVQYFFRDSFGGLIEKGIYFLDELIYIDLGFDLFLSSLISLTISTPVFINPGMGEFMPYIYTGISINW